MVSVVQPTSWADAGGLQLESDEIRVKLDKHHATVQELLPKV
jgi:hypothetical protein